ncbi:MAG: alpha/beta hydrolase [Gemmatimonadota bacterium]
MKRIVSRTILLLLVLIVAVVAWGASKNPEHATLDAAAREGVAGQFSGSTLGVTHYEVAGPDSGAVVVLVHGFSVPMYIWDSLFTTLANAGYRTIRYDLLGRGWSDRPDAAYDGAMYDQQLDELLDSLHVTKPINLMGLSFGGFVTGHYVATHAKRVNTLTLIDPAASTSHPPAWLGWPVVGSWIWQTTQVPSMADNQASDFLHPERFPGWADAYRTQMRYRGFGRALLRSVHTMELTDFDSLYAATGRTGVPALLVWGKQDSTVPFTKAAVVRGGIPQVEFFPVDSSGHLPHMEQAPLVRARVLEFLAAHNGAAVAAP